MSFAMCHGLGAQDQHVEGIPSLQHTIFRKSFRGGLRSWLEGDWEAQTQRSRLQPPKLDMSSVKLVVFIFPMTELPFWGKAAEKGGEVPANHSVSQAGA